MPSSSSSSGESRAVFLLPHPDDEFACSILLGRLVDSGVDVHCIYLTDGGYGGQSLSIRRQESLAALGSLGLGESSACFLGAQHGFADGRLADYLEPALHALRDTLPDLGESDVLYVPAWEGGHQDHDAAHVLGLVFAAQCGVHRIRQFPLYTGEGLPGPFFRVASPLRKNGPPDPIRLSWVERWRAIGLCLHYRSQWKTWVGLLPLFAIRILLVGTMVTQPVNLSAVRELPHVGRPLYERRAFKNANTLLRELTLFLENQLDGNLDQGQGC